MTWRRLNSSLPIQHEPPPTPANRMTTPTSLRVSVWKAQSLGWAGILVFSVLVIGTLVSGTAVQSLWAVPFILLSGGLLLITGPIIATTETLGQETPLGRFELPWAVIDRIEVGQSLIVFFAGDRRLTLVKPPYWSGADKPALLAAMEAQIRDRQLLPKQTFRADFLVSKGTKVS